VGGGKVPDNAIGTLADNIEDLIALADVEVAGTRIVGCSHDRQVSGRRATPGDMRVSERERARGGEQKMAMEMVGRVAVGKAMRLEEKRDKRERTRWEAGEGKSSRGSRAS
jgi:hypothetical protein